MEEKPKAVKRITAEQALVKAMKFCAYQERSQQQVRDKLYSFGLHKGDVESVIGKLIEHGFLKEERFAVAFATGKMRIKKWGSVKIKQALREKQVSEPLIKLAIATLDSKEYVETLKSLIIKKNNQLSEKNIFKRKFKIAQYCIGHGFEPELVWDCLRVSE